MSGKKVYTGRFLFGVETDSHDCDGQELSSSDVFPSFADLKKATNLFNGTFLQTPPKISAKKVAGRRAYDLVRGSKEFDLEPCTVAVDSFFIDESYLENDPVREISFRITCSKGTYIRGIARDLGESVGCPSILASLRRECSFPFSIDEAVEPAQVEYSDLIDLSRLFSGIKTIRLEEEDLKKLSNGNYSSLLDDSLFNRINESTDQKINLHLNNQFIMLNNQENLPKALLIISDKGEVERTIQL
jgi:tRNA pseudouridine55 synthase